MLVCDDILSHKWPCYSKSDQAGFLGADKGVICVKHVITCMVMLHVTKQGGFLKDDRGEICIQTVIM